MAFFTLPAKLEIILAGKAGAADLKKKEPLPAPSLPLLLTFHVNLHRLPHELRQAGMHLIEVCYSVGRGSN
jgi:hypothetical protein